RRARGARGRREPDRRGPPRHPRRRAPPRARLRRRPREAGRARRAAGPRQAAGAHRPRRSRARRVLVARGPRRHGRLPPARSPEPVVSAEPRVAVVTDTADDVNGVALGLRRLAAAAARAALPLQLIGPGAGRAVTVDADGVVRVPTWTQRALRC